MGDKEIEKSTLILIGAGMLIGALLSGMMTARAAALQRRGKHPIVIKV